jgi:ElaB/YqjD/DUF883 family membrane-anchored ribosome-binding protein
MTEHNVTSNLERMGEDLEKIRSELADWTKAVRRISGGRVRAARAELGARAADWGEDLQEALADTRKRSRRAMLAVQHQVQERPVISALTLLGVLSVGFALARLLGRR